LFCNQINAAFIKKNKKTLQISSIQNFLNAYYRWWKYAISYAASYELPYCAWHLPLPLHIHVWIQIEQVSVFAMYPPHEINTPLEDHTRWRYVFMLSFQSRSECVVFVVLFNRWMWRLWFCCCQGRAVVYDWSKTFRHTEIKF